MMVPFKSMIAAFEHHMNYDEARVGYPRIRNPYRPHVIGRIVAIADCFDAMTTSRTYRNAVPVAAALAEVRRCSGTQFDPELATRLLEIDPAELHAVIRLSAPPNPAVDGAAAFQSDVASERIGSTLLDAESLGSRIRRWQRLKRRATR